jgi:hypothetical protein
LLDSEDSNNSYEGLLGLLIVDFGVRIIFLDIRVAGIARARDRKIILFDREINEGNRARIPRFGAFLCSLYKPYGPFFYLFRRFLFHFRFPAFGFLSHLAAGLRLSPDDLRVKKKAYLVFREHWPVSITLSLTSGLDRARSDKVNYSKGRGEADL